MVDAASQILNTTWTGVNDTVRHDMSAEYLEAVEMLVENIHINRSRSFKTDNLELKVCPNTDCNVTVFDIEVSLNRTTGRPKIMAVRNLTPKLDNNYPRTEKTEFLLSATLGLDRDENGTTERRSSDVEIYLEFPLQGDVQSPVCVFWNVTTKSWSDEGCNMFSRDANGTSCYCNHLTSFSVLMAKGDISTPELDVITSIGLGVSLCCLLIFLVIEFLVWSAVVKTNLSHFRHTAIVNIATFRLLADCSFLASSSPEILSDGMCLAFTVSKHLFYTAMFCWMLCLSVMLVHQLIFVFSPLRKRVFMFLSSVVGYLVPIIIVGSSYVYYRYTYKPYYDNKTCWLNFERLLEGSIHAFLIPVGIVIMINIFSMVVVIVTLVKTQTPDSGKADDKETAKSIIKVLVVLAPVFGVTWVIGFFLLILDHDNPVFPAANYTFTILNSFQEGLQMSVGITYSQTKTTLVSPTKAA
uniref:Adhesion G protein-coupled receptor F3b n=1 Tax=Salarias fasciatus TaxID=181472 RepID=A0A672FRR2_SALFA